jgi:curved DNA-binding protein CbpA
MTNQVANPYAVLGVPPTATAAQVRDAYRRLAKEFHPDRQADADATERMQRINKAFQMLSSPSARANYDARTAGPAAGSYPHWGGTPRTSAAPYQWAEPTWRTAGSASAAEYARADDIGPFRWGLLLLALPPIIVLLTALFGALVPLPIIGIVIFVIARAVLSRGD